MCIRDSPKSRSPRPDTPTACALATVRASGRAGSAASQGGCAVKTKQMALGAITLALIVAGCGGSSAPSLSAYKTSFKQNKVTFRCLLYTSDAADEEDSVDL